MERKGFQRDISRVVDGLKEEAIQAKATTIWTNKRQSPWPGTSPFTLNKELKKIGLEVGDLNLINLAVYRKKALHLLGINATVRLNQIKKKRVWINLTIFCYPYQTLNVHQSQHLKMGALWKSLPQTKSDMQKIRYYLLKQDKIKSNHISFIFWINSENHDEKDNSWYLKILLSTIKGKER